MAFLVSSSDGGSVEMGKSFSEGDGRSDGRPLSLLSKALKCSLYSASSSVSLLGTDPSLFLTFTFCLLSFPERSWIIFHVVL